MQQVSPWTASMGLFTVMAQLVVIVEDSWTAYRPDSQGPQWRCAASALTLPLVVKEGLFVTATRIKSYTLADLVRTLDLVALHWYRLSATPDLRVYPYALLHRACILTGHPGHERVFNVERLRESIPGADKLYCLNDDGVRTVSTPLLRMICMADIGRRCPDSPPPCLPAAVSAAEHGVRTFMRTQVRLVMKMAQFKREIAANFARYMLLHGDVEKWVAKRGIELSRAPSLLMTVRPYTQPAYAMLREFSMVDRMVELMDERHPDYFQRWTRPEHAYATLCKLSLASAPVSSFGAELLRDYVIPELEIVTSIQKFSRAREPVVIQLFGHMHVYHAGNIIRCECTEHAVAVWALVIVNRLGGVLDGKHVAPGIRLLIDPQQQNTANSKVVGSIVDD